MKKLINTSKNSVIIIFLLFGFYTSNAQEEVHLNAEEANIESTISEQDKTTLLTSLDQLLSDYIRTASLLDATMDRVTQESQTEFIRLFTRRGSLVFQDYYEQITEGEQLVPVEDYCYVVDNNMGFSGVLFIIEEAKLIDLSTDKFDDEFYTAEMIITKVMNNHISKDKKLEQTFKRYELKITIDIYKEKLERATIQRIESNEEIAVVDFYNRYIGITLLGGGSSNYNLQSSDYWNDNHSNSSLKLSGGLNYSVGLEFITDKLITRAKSSNRKISMNLGLMYSSYEMNSSLTNFALNPFDVTAIRGDSTQLYSRLVGPVSVEEQLRFGVLEIPLGIGYTLLDNTKSSFIVFGKLVPGIVLTGNGNIDGTGHYDGVLYKEDTHNLSQYQVLEANASNPEFINENVGYAAFDVGTQAIKLESNPLLKSTVLALKVSPTYYLKFDEDKNPGWGIMIALDFGYQLGSFIEHNPATNNEEEAFHFNDDYNNSLTSYYADGVSAITYGFRIGLFQRNQLNP